MNRYTTKTLILWSLAPYTFSTQVLWALLATLGYILFFMAIGIRRWARLIKHKAWVKHETNLVFILGESEELIRIFHSSIHTAQRNAPSAGRNPAHLNRYPSLNTA